MLSWACKMDVEHLLHIETRLSAVRLRTEVVRCENLPCQGTHRLACATGSKVPGFFRRAK
jgi:hypothetical protein